MKKNDVTLLILCIIYSIISMIYIFGSNNGGQIISVIQFLIIYIPFFILLFVKEKKYAAYIALAFCGYELIASFLNYIQYLVAFVKNFNEMLSANIILVLLGKIISNMIKVYLVFNIIFYLREENKKYEKLIIIFFGIYFLTIFSYIILNKFRIDEIIAPIKEILLNVILIIFVMDKLYEKKLKTS